MGRGGRMNDESRLQISLLLLRLSIFIVMFMWTLDKFINPEHSAAVYSKFYFITGLESSIILVIGMLELILLLAFLVGFQQRITYGVVLVLHAISTLSSYNQYLDPYSGSNLLFFAAWPMLAACFALYLLRDSDKKWVI